MVWQSRLDMNALLISTFELGHQPFGLASPAAWLRRDGVAVRVIDLTRGKLPDDAVRSADLVAFHLPMHTATRLAGPVIRKVRALNPLARLCAYGLYAPLNTEWLQSLGVDDVLGGEFEEQLSRIAREMAGAGPDKARPTNGGPIDTGPIGANLSDAGQTSDPELRDVGRTPDAQLPDVGRTLSGPPAIPRLQFLVPDRAGLPPLSRYATLHVGDGADRVVGYTEASRGCRHLCRHCPVVPVYNGQFRVVQRDVVLADIAAQVAAGAEHITFGDPDFLNGPTHAIRVVDALHVAHPGLTYDVTIKIEHLLAHRDLLPRFVDTGCLFVTSAVESLDDSVLAILDKGHTRRDFLQAVSVCRAAGITLVPTFVAFHPWLTLERYCDLLDTIADLDLIDHVAPIQLAIRLLIPQGSRLLEVDEVSAVVGSFDPRTLTYRWSHQDPRVDLLQEEIASIVGSRLVTGRHELFEEISALAHRRAEIPAPPPRRVVGRAPVPHLSEPWYCCAEPNPEQLTLV